MILENVTPDGQELPGSAGRLMLPGTDYFMLNSTEHEIYPVLKF